MTPVLDAPGFRGLARMSQVSGRSIRPWQGQPHKSLHFKGIYDELELARQEISGMGAVETLKDLLESEKTVLTINKKNLTALDLLALVGDLTARELKFQDILGGVVGGVLTTGVGIPVLLSTGLVGFGVVFLGGVAVIGLNSLLSRADVRVKDQEIIKLDATLLRDQRNQLWAGLCSLSQAGLISLIDGDVQLTMNGRKALNLYRPLKAGAVVPAKAEAPAGVTANAGDFSYEKLSKADRFRAMKALMADGTSEKGISGFQVLEALSVKEAARSRVGKYFRPGLSAKELCPVGVEAAFLSRQLAALQQLGFVAREDSSKPRWSLTGHGKTVLALGDPAVSGMLKPEDLHEMMQADIDRLEAEKEKQRQQFVQLQAEFGNMTAAIKGLEEKVVKLQAGDLTESATPDVPLVVQLERARRELELSRKLAGRFQLVVDGQALVVQKNREKLDARITELLDGQVQVRVMKMNHSMAEILKQLQQESGVFEAGDGEILLSKLTDPALATEVPSQAEELSLSVSADHLLKALQQDEKKLGGSTPG